jgi:hypothetical protein
MENVEEFLDNRSRRDVLRTSGAALTAGLTAGCLGNGGDSSNTTSGDTEEEEESNQTSSNSDTTSKPTDTQAQGYPQQKSQKLQSDIDQFIRENDGRYGLKASIEDLSIKQFNNVAENIPNYDNKEQMVGNSWEFDRALYVISEVETPAGPTEDVYFVVQDPEKISGEVNSIAMYANSNEQNTDLTDQNVQVIGVPREYDEERLTDTQEVIDLQQEFLSETLSADDVVHAVNLEDTYVEDAIE